MVAAQTLEELGLLRLATEEKTKSSPLNAGPGMQHVCEFLRAMLPSAKVRCWSACGSAKVSLCRKSAGKSTWPSKETPTRL